MTTASGPKPPPRYIWQQPDWPRFRIDTAALADDLQQARLCVFRRT